MAGMPGMGTRARFKPCMRTRAGCKPCMDGWNTRHCDGREVGKSLYAYMVIKGIISEALNFNLPVSSPMSHFCAVRMAHVPTLHHHSSLCLTTFRQPSDRSDGACMGACLPACLLPQATIVPPSLRLMSHTHAFQI